MEVWGRETRREVQGQVWGFHKQLKPGLVASYDTRRGNGKGLFWFRRFISVTYLLI